MTKRDWRTMNTAPKDGTEIVIQLPPYSVRAFWCSDMQQWVLSRPLNVESIHDPLVWEPTAAITAGDGENAKSPPQP